eukprot:Plantae.Rhodophyta-Purpureofilum_apyrenoidigerum.ctg21706.p1 GENE.Plantae.Rhodophyta-Purpureofilum_apyrenoidigerum.ctg21706~~Plantae.Rhodophyta-Purpureofilum_apyrenoidigerum.ctg21706.p1  ORF type:complete len:376 (+),score=56.07 Plantae.Rhodophyta-Purpureofilum_apyrenoidigerum.ctg21706:98-1225(+)
MRDSGGFLRGTGQAASFITHGGVYVTGRRCARESWGHGTCSANRAVHQRFRPPARRPGEGASATRHKGVRRNVALKARDDEHQGKVSNVPNRNPRRELLTALAVLSVHLVAGVLFCILHLKWNVADSLYFCVVTITTVGYGDLTPPTAKAKLFFIVYILLSLTIIGSAINSVIGTLLERQENALYGLFVGGSDDTENQESAKPLWAGYTAQEAAMIASAGIVFLSIIFGGMLFFMKVEKLSVIDALYFIWITSTTVGFGDLTPKGPISRTFSVLFLLASTLSLANFIGTFADVQLQRRHRAFRERALHRKLGSVDLRDMDENDDQKLSRDEFLIAMLRRTDAVPQEDIDAILSRFDELDLDNDGFIDEKEIELSA